MNTQEKQSLNFTGKIAYAFLHNRPLSLLIFLSIVFAGIMSYMATPKQYNPEVILPAFQITVPYPGASAEEVETFVTSELEEKIADIEGVDKIYSRSLDGGMSIVNVEFFVGEDLETSRTKVHSKLLENMDLQIGNIGKPFIKNITPDDVPILTFGFTSHRFNQNQIRYFALEIMEKLKKIKDIANLEVHGGERKALLVFPDPQKMKFLQVDFSEIQYALQANNGKFSVGGIENDSHIIPIKVDGRIVHKKDAEDISVLPNVKLGDIARIEEGYAEKTSFVSVYQKDTNIKEGFTQDSAVFLSIAKKKNTNAIIVSQEVISRLEEIMKDPQYKDIQWKIYRNEGEVASLAINDLGINLITSIGIVLLVLIFFLGIRPAIIVATAIPLTLALVFVSGYLFGQTINRITLFSLILSLGLLVDSATVVVENIYRHLYLHKNRRTAIVTAVNEVGIGLFLSTLTSVIVFLPTSKISGMMGAYMVPLSFFVPMALLFSMIISYKITPFLADILLPIAQKKSTASSYVFDSISEWYARFLKNLLSNTKKQKWFLFSTFLLLFFVSLFPIFRFVHFRMLPNADKNQFYVYLDTFQNNSKEKTFEISDQVTEFLLKNENVLSVQSFVGEAPVVDFNGLYKGAHLRKSPHLATLRVNLQDTKQRSISSSQIVEQIRSHFMKEFLEVYESNGVRFVEDPPGPPVSATLVAKIKGENDDIRNAFVHFVEQKFKKTEGVVDQDTSLEDNFAQVSYSIDAKKALASGVNTHQVTTTLKGVLEGGAVTQYHLPHQNEMAFIFVRFPKDKRDEVLDLKNIHMKNKNGEMIPLSSLVLEKVQKEPQVFYNDKRERTEYISAEISGRSVVYAVIDLLQEFIFRPPQTLNGAQFVSKNWNLYRIEYHYDNGETVSIEWGGEFEMTLDNFRDLGIAMFFAFLLIYVVLVAQFRSFLRPALIMVTIPLAFIGILPGFAILDFVNGTFLTATSLIGFIALMGIVVNNAILYLEYVEQLICKGKEKQEALIEAGKTRLRPIMLTSLTTVLGSLTIASDPVWSGLAFSIVFGLSLSTVLTLIVFPVLYNMTLSLQKSEQCFL